MLILTIRTDKPEAEVGLFDTQTKLAYETWPAHRQLAETIHQKIRDLLSVQGRTLDSIEGVICFRGPGSYTGLRIGLSVGNALAAGLRVPIMATKGKNWLNNGVICLGKGQTDHIALPLYKASARTTAPRK